jgi:hypothetical protein
MSRRVGNGTPDPKVGGSNPLRHALISPHITLEIRDLGTILGARPFCLWLL